MTLASHIYWDTRAGRWREGTGDRSPESELPRPPPPNSYTRRIPPKPKRPRGASPTTKPSPTAIATITRSKTLSHEHRALLAEALRQGEETRNVMEDKLVDFGRWMLVHIFDDDADAALGNKRDNPVWLELKARAGGPTLRLGSHILHVALEIAARDRRITDQAWRLLEAGRKELLLPLEDEALMRRAAQHVVAMKLSLRATERYVTALRAEQGKPRASRVSVPRFHASMKRFHGRVAEPAFRRKLERSLRELPDEQRASVRTDVAALRDWATEMLSALRR